MPRIIARYGGTRDRKVYHFSCDNDAVLFGTGLVGTHQVTRIEIDRGKGCISPIWDETWPANVQVANLRELMTEGFSG